MIEPGTFLYFVDTEAIHMWEFDRTKKVLIRKESKQGLDLDSELVKALQHLFIQVLDLGFF